MSSQVESRHFFRTRDTVQDRYGTIGRVASASALYALVEWADGRAEEVEQFDPEVEVVTRAEPA